MNTNSELSVDIPSSAKQADDKKELRYGLFLLVAPAGGTTQLPAPFIEVPATEWRPVLTKGLAFGAHIVGNVDKETTDGIYAAVHSSKETKASFYSNTSVVLVKKETHLPTLVRAALGKGLYISGLRTLYPTSVELDRCPSVLKNHLQKFGKNVVVAFRGPGCFSILRDIIGPSPEIARKTDPDSLNARFGGLDGSHVTSPAARGMVDLCWVFGGRLEDVAPVNGSRNQKYSAEELDRIAKEAIGNVVHALHVFPEVIYSAGLTRKVEPKVLCDKLSDFLKHAGRVLSINPQKYKSGDSTSSFIVTAVREGGAVLLKELNLFHTTFADPTMEQFGLKVKK